MNNTYYYYYSPNDYSHLDNKPQNRLQTNAYK